LILTILFDVEIMYSYVETRSLFADVFMMIMTWQFGVLCYLFVATFCWKFMHVVWRLIEDVTTISWIFTIFAYFIA